MYEVVPIASSLLADACIIDRGAGAFPWTEKQLSDSFKHHQCYGLLQNSQLKGFAIFQVVSVEASLLNIAIARDLQGLGLAKQLLSASFSKLIEQGAEECFLEVRTSNHAAIALYEKLGFEQIGCRKNYYPAGAAKEDALLMRLMFQD